jgi:hypothetical protein
MPPKNGTMILPVSNLSDLVENELATGENSGALFGKISTLLEHNHTATVTMTMAMASKLCIIDGLPTFVRCNSETAPRFMKLMAEPVLEVNRKVGSTQP